MGPGFKYGRSKFGLLAVLAILVTRSTTAFAGPYGSRGKTEVGITVRVYDFEHLRKGTLTTAEKNAATILRKAGLTMRWCNVPMTPEENSMNSDCIRSTDSAGLELRIVSQLKVVPGNTTESTQGFALGDIATVSYHWIADADIGGLVQPEEILGCVIAHEIGHILLGPNSHSRTGIMMGKWNPEAFRDAGQGRLLFTPQQERLIRAEVLGRSGKRETSRVQMRPLRH